MKKLILLLCLVLSVSEARAGRDILNPTFKGSGIGLLVGIGAGTIVGFAARDFEAGSIVFGSCVLAGALTGLLIGIFDSSPSDGKAALINFDQKSASLTWSVPAMVPLFADTKAAGVHFNLFSARLF